MQKKDSAIFPILKSNHSFCILTVACQEVTTLANLQISIQPEWKPLPSHSWNLPDRATLSSQTMQATSPLGLPPEAPLLLLGLVLSESSP